MKDYQYIILDRKGSVGHIRLDRPEKHHALNLEMIRELKHAVSGLDREPDLRVLTLSASGKHFCSGADLDWMRSGMEQDRGQLHSESLEMAGLFRQIANCGKIFLVAVQGRVMGGAIGLLAAADLVLAEESACFAFSEVKLGLVPATIAPYVLKRAGRERSRAWMLSGRTFGAAEAREGGLVHFLCPEGRLEEEMESLVRDLLENGEEAMKGIEELLESMEQMEQMDPEKSMEYTAGLIARYRTSEEGQRRMKAFLDRNKNKGGGHAS